LQTRQFWNGSRYDRASTAGFYESYFQRANHPTKPRAFWIRYTIFSPKNAPEAAEGELWAIWFDSEKKEVFSFYQALPVAQCSFSKEQLQATIGNAQISEHHLLGEMPGMSWDLTFKGEAPPLLLFPEAFYERKLPKAKVLVGTPLAKYEGVLRFGEREERIDGWLGSQNHNWGSKHTDLYAWGQVAGFQGANDVFLECATAKIKVAGLWMPRLSPLVLRIDGKEHRLNEPRHLWKTKGTYRDWRWQIDAEGDGIQVRAVFSGDRDNFAVLPYRNPPGGVKRCLNTKIARCEMTVTIDGKARQLVSPHGAAFEMLGDPAKLDGFGFKT
jgi:hypothetical protein